MHFCQILIGQRVIILPPQNLVIILPPQNLLTTPQSKYILNKNITTNLQLYF